MSAAAVHSVRLRIEYVELLFQSTQVREEHEKVEQQFQTAIATILSGINCVTVECAIAVLITMFLRL